MNKKPYTRAEIEHQIKVFEEEYVAFPFIDIVKQLMMEHDELIEYINSYREAIIKSIDMFHDKNMTGSLRATIDVWRLGILDDILHHTVGTKKVQE